jgi:hypothetical protein
VLTAELHSSDPSLDRKRLLSNQQDAELHTCTVTLLLGSSWWDFDVFDDEIGSFVFLWAPNRWVEVQVFRAVIACTILLE